MARSAPQSPAARSPASAADPAARHTGGTRAVILAAALRTFAEDGELRMERVAQVAGVSRATLYYHFHGRDPLVAVLLDEGLEELAAEVTRAAASGDPVRIVETVVRHYCDNETRSRLLFTSVWSQPSGPQVVLRRLDDAVVGPLRHAVATCVAAGRCSETDPAVAAEALFGMANEVVLGRVIRGEPLDAGVLVPRLAQLARRALTR